MAKKKRSRQADVSWGWALGPNSSKLNREHEKLCARLDRLWEKMYAEAVKKRRKVPPMKVS
jgi:hypothetical protein